jgi:hypothetical protein
MTKKEPGTREVELTFSRFAAGNNIRDGRAKLPEGGAFSAVTIV